MKLTITIYGTARNEFKLLLEKDEQQVDCVKLPPDSFVSLCGNVVTDWLEEHAGDGHSAELVMNGVNPEQRKIIRNSLKFSERAITNYGELFPSEPELGIADFKVNREIL